jgi:hypothetical protein
MTTRIKLRRDTAANWTLNNPTLAAGEPGLETDTGKTKYGDGTTAWITLGYATGGITAREQIGYFNFHGPVPTTVDGDDWWFESVETDPEGNAYYVGGNDQTEWPHVVKVNSLGELQWQKEITWADGWEGNATSAVYNTATDQLVVVAAMYKDGANSNNDLGAAVITMNPNTGAIVGNPKMIRDEVTSDGTPIGDIDPSDIILDANGDPIVVGHKNGSASTYALTTTSVGTTDVIFVAAAIFTDKTPRSNSDWYITGTNISEVSIIDVNRYDNQPPGVISSSGTNATFSVQWKINTDGQAYFPDYPERFGASWYQNGSGYALNDTLYLNPEQYGGSTSATITVTSVGGSGEISDFTFTGTFNTSTIKLITNGGTDFSTTGSWTAINYSSEAFIWTQGWAKTFGDSGTDKVNVVAKDSNDNIYLACQTYDETSQELGSPYYGVNLPLLVKLDSNGNQLWAKKFTPAGWNSDNDGYSGVAVDSNNDVIVVEDSVVTKIDGSGTVIWQKIIGLNDPFGMGNTCVVVDSDDNIYVTGIYSYMGQTTSDDFLIVKFDTDGNLLWQREAGTNNDEDSNWDNGYQILSVSNGQVYITGSSVQGTDDVAVAITFPVDGSGADANHRGRFFLHTATWSVSTTTATVYNYTIAVTSTQVTVTNETNITSVTTSTDNSTLALRTGDVDGRIEDLYSLSFEDGSVQTTAYTGALIREENFFENTNNFYPNLTHANKLMRWDNPQGNSSVDIYVPSDADVAFPIGTQMHFVKERGIRAFMFWPNGNIGNENDITIMPSSPADGRLSDMYDTGEGWSVRHPNYDKVPAKVTLTKVDTNRWLLECSSPTHIMDWSW